MGKRLGLVIGTNNYEDKKLKKLDYAEDDANAIKGVLLDPEICRFDDVRELMHPTLIQASMEIERLFNDAGTNDFIVLYFSGHGKLDKENKFCLLLEETKLNSLLATSLHFDFVNKCIKQSDCATVIVIIDSCYSGAAGLKSSGLQAELFKASGSGTVVISATKEFDVARENKKLKHGVFTYFLLEGLKSGAADTDGNGIISLEELYDYCYNKSKEFCSQEPLKEGKIEGSILIGRNIRKLREKLYDEKVKKLFNLAQNRDIPLKLYDEAINILKKGRGNALNLLDVEKNIYDYLEALLDDKITVETYICTINILKNETKKDRCNFPRDTDIENTKSLARKAFINKRYETAMEYWKAVLMQNPTDNEALESAKEIEAILEKLKRLYQKGISAYETHKWAKAIKAFEDIESIHNDYKDVPTRLKDLEQEISKLAPNLEKIDKSITIKDEAEIKSNASDNLPQINILIDEAHQERSSLNDFDTFKGILREWGKLTILKNKPLSSERLLDQNILIIIGPLNPLIFNRGSDKWMDGEVEAIRTFVNRGGKLLILGYYHMSTNNINLITSNFGIYFTNDIINDEHITDLVEHPLTKGIEGLNLYTFEDTGGKYLHAEYPAFALASHNNKPVLVSSECGQGRVVAISSVGVVTKKGLEKNALFLDKLLSYLSQ